MFQAFPCTRDGRAGQRDNARAHGSTISSRSKPPRQSTGLKLRGHLLLLTLATLLPVIVFALVATVLLAHRETPRRLVLRTRPVDGDRVQVDVIDTGAGVAAE